MNAPKLLKANFTQEKDASQPYTIRRTTRSSLSTEKHALTVPVSRTHATGRTFIQTTGYIWNSLPDNVVDRITDNNLQSFKTRVHRTTAEDMEGDISSSPLRYL
ncbi:hypothetical protein Bbelb_369830 [Branchiostoma belcheri]|nr:hypothetical protein Bbelb_369830 [Branchiostoma belcheri]